MKPEKWNADTASAFHASMLELGLLGALILILVLCIVLLRRGNPTLPELTQ